PALGEHTRDVLAEVGFSEDKIEELLSRDVAFAASVEPAAVKAGGAPRSQQSPIAGSLGP
ncbi:MAG TPA: hypothetical protein VKB68_02050, partial [Stellaceae bacterium]|nr:hypothetical protein [Stellaceae bacterium]